MVKLCCGSITLPGVWGWPPVLFIATISFLCEGISRTLSPKDPVSDKPMIPGMAISMLAGCLIRNTRMSCWIGLRDSLQEHPTSRLRWGEGLCFVESTVLRSAVILLGFNIPPLFRGSNGTSSEYALAVACIIIPINQLVAFFVVQGFTRLIRMDKVSRDLISVGTMNAGCSAVFSHSMSLKRAETVEGDETMAKARAERAERIGATTALCVSALMCVSLLVAPVFRPLSEAAAMSDSVGGLWAGLASHTLAVASQFGDTGEIFASLAIVMRQLAMGPAVMLFGLCTAGAAGRSKRASCRKMLWANLPLWTLGILGTAAFRVALDEAAPHQREIFVQMGKIVSVATRGCFNAILASIGLRLKGAILLKSWKFMVVFAVGAASMSASSLVMVQVALGKVDPADKMVASLGMCIGAGFGLILVSGAFFSLCLCFDRWRRRRALRGIGSELPATTPKAPPCCTPCASVTPSTFGLSPCALSPRSASGDAEPAEPSEPARPLPTLKLGQARGANLDLPSKTQTEAQAQSQADQDLEAGGESGQNRAPKLNL